MLYLILIIINILLFFILHNLAPRIKLIDYPSNRKKHIGEIPLVGGISIYLTMFLGIFFIDIDYNLKFILYSAFIVTLIGIFDDIKSIGVKIRFFCQLLASLIVIAKGIFIHDLSFINLDENYSLYLYFLIPFTLLCVIGLINAINFFDGIDGLSSLIFLKSVVLIIILISFKNDNFNYNFFYLLFIAVIPFVIFNLGFIKGFKIFLGDSGSLLLGFLLSWILIFFSQNPSQDLDPLLVIWIVPIVVFDFFAVFIYRILKGVNPFSPDNLHLHHILIKKFSNTFVLISILFASTIISIIGITIYFLFGPYYSFILYFLFMNLYLFINFRLRAKFLSL